jgi:hypothetical protein
MWPIAFMVTSSALTAPAIGSLLLVGLASRWSLVRGSAIASVVAGAILTFLSFYVSILFLSVILKMELFAREWVLALPWLAGFVILTTFYLHYRWRAGLDGPRVAGIASCVLLLVGAFVTDQLTR